MGSQVPFAWIKAMEDGRTLEHYHGIPRCIGDGMQGQQVGELERPSPARETVSGKHINQKRGNYASAGRESERCIVLMKPRTTKPGRGKAPYFIHDSGGGKSE